MRIRERTYPNRQVRTFNFDEVISPEPKQHYNHRTHSPEVERLFATLNSIHLVNQVDLDRYSVRIQIQDGFQYGDEDWGRVRESVIKAVTSHLGLLPEDIDHAVMEA